MKLNFKVSQRVKAGLWSFSALLWFVAAFVAFAPPPGPARAQFVDQSTYGGTSGGSANAQTITIANYTSHQAGVTLKFVPGFTNTGPVTINVSGLGNVAVVRPSSIGNVAMSGSELFAGELTCVVYNGTAYQLSCNVDLTPIGKTVEYRGASTPRGVLIEDGSCAPRTTYAPLFAVIGTTYGACDGSTTFGLPDSRGTMFAALDNQGANGAANRINSAGSGCTGTSVGLCGSQSATLTLPQLPTANLNTSSLTITAIARQTSGVTTPGGGANIYLDVLQTSGGGGTSSATYALAGAIPLGSGQSHPTLNPVLLGRRGIKY